jgi:hypothetical protein
MRGRDWVNMRRVVHVAMSYAGETMKINHEETKSAKVFLRFFFFVSSWLIFGGVFMSRCEALKR